MNECEFIGILNTSTTRSNSVHRKIWEHSFGKIPRDNKGRSYEIHHIDGNHQNNSIENLKLVTIEEHYNIHLDQGDYGACMMIAQRMSMPPDFISEIQRGIKRPGIGGRKKGSIPWNKNIKGYSIHTEKSKRQMSEKLSGSNNGRSILTENDVNTIIQLYLSKPELEKVGKVQSNGLKMSYDWAFSNKIASDYGVTPAAIKRLILKKSWKNVWQKYEV